MLVLAAACRQLVGIDDAPPTALDLDGSPEAGACGVAYGGECGACLTASCCNEATACADDPECSAFESCLAACAAGDDACRAQCSVRHPIGLSTAAAELQACLVSHCMARCDLSCGSMAALFTPPDAAGACVSCVRASSACGTALACQQSVDCVELDECLVSGSPGLDRTQACSTQHEAGAALFGPFLVQFSGSCATPCASGNDWACVGNVTPATALSSQTAVRLDLGIFGTSNEAPAGVQVSACAAATPGCPSPLDTATTDDDGHATVKVDQTIGRPGFQGYYEISSPGGGFVPELLYLSFALQESQVEIPLPSLIDPASFQGVLAGFGIDAGTGGSLALIAYDCLDAQSPGVQFATSMGDDAGLRTLYVANGSFSTTATQTDTSGMALIANVPAGPVDVFAKPGGLSGASSHLSVNVEAGKITVVLLFPD